MRAWRQLGEEVVEHNPEFFAQTGIRFSHRSGLALPNLVEGCLPIGLEAKLVIACSSTYDELPPLSAYVANNVSGVEVHYDLNAACAGPVHALIQASYRKPALVVGADRFPSSWPGLSDGAAAILVEPTDILRGAAFHTDTSNLHAVTLRGGHFEMNGMAVFNQAARHFPKVLRDCIDQAGWAKDDVDLWVLHQANGRMLEFLRERMGVEYERWFVNVEHSGNSGAASIPGALAEAEIRKRLHGKIVIAGIGAGFGFAAAAFEVV